ncbi:MAG: hypothetical protein H5T75_02070 [Coriobacteriia bacterium]|nr:hypothetical protein [Coriobacteriia bacterium]
MKEWSRRTVVTSLVLALVAAVAFFAMRLACGNEDAAGAISTAGAVAFALFATGSAFDVARRLKPGEPLRAQVVLIGLGMAALVMGDFLYWLLESVLGLSPYPSVADVFYVASFPLLGGGLMLALRAFSRGNKQPMPLAAAVAASLLATFAVWGTVLAPVFGDSEISILEKVLDALYPVGDLWLLLLPALALAIALGRFAGGRLAVPWVIVAVGAVLMAATDTAYTWMDYAGTYVSGSFIDVGWWLAYAAIGLGMIALADAQGLRGGRR